ncbi:outer membrane protein assembly factor BamE [Pelomonas sp. KK5]|uniref:outer membrane protein assembly factor BamE n=1 Tax=Pelomonas sp. KK5 TaxID=1855730 RepID=UPI001E53B1B9|nr:outer membrane protein assembly factor BamE [Pelomonas sp. KK5]
MRPIPRSPLPLRPLAGAMTLAALAVLSGCSSMPSLSSIASVSGDKVLGFVTPYRIEIVQGNVLTKEQVAKVKPGMSRAQVRDLLGSPLLTDMFHDNRWDYAFSIRRQGAPYQQRLVVAWFDGDALKSLDGAEDLPTENEFVAAVNTFKPSGSLPKLELSEAERKALPVPARVAEPTPEQVGPQRSYPPLEPRS